MARPKRSKKGRGAATYVLPILFCALLILLALVRGQRTEAPTKAVLQKSEPLTLTHQAIENYLYAAGFTLQREKLLTAEGREAGTLAITADDAIEEMTLTFSLPPRIDVETGADVFASLNEAHDKAAQEGKDMFLSLFDAIAVTDGRVAGRRDSALEKLQQTMDTGKSSAQAAYSWKFTFSVTAGDPESQITILFTLVK